MIALTFGLIGHPKAFGIATAAVLFDLCIFNAPFGYIKQLTGVYVQPRISNATLLRVAYSTVRKILRSVKLAKKTYPSNSLV